MTIYLRDHMAIHRTPNSKAHSSLLRAAVPCNVSFGFLLFDLDDPGDQQTDMPMGRPHMTFVRFFVKASFLHLLVVFVFYLVL